MKKTFIGLLILVLSAWAQYVFSAEPIQLARMNGYVAAGVGAGAASGTWVIIPANRGETLTPNMTDYYISSPITVPGTHITKVALKIKDKLSATTVHIKLTTGATGLLSVRDKGNCTPASETWCKVAVDYTGSVGTTYHILMTADSSPTTYGDSDAGIGGYGIVTPDWATWVGSTSNQAITNDTFANLWAVAVCYDGECTGEPD
jgi:hypothetical protein